MKGENTLILNTATITEAVQQYLDRTLVQQVTVSALEFEKGSYADDNPFSVMVTVKPVEESL